MSSPSRSGLSEPAASIHESGKSMSEEVNPLVAMLPVLVTEARRRRLALAIIFAAIALIALIVGVNWPLRYDASVTILAQKSNIIAPLMEGAASTTGTTNRAAIAGRAGQADPGNQVAHHCHDRTRQSHHDQLPRQRSEARLRRDPRIRPVV